MSKQRIAEFVNPAEAAEDRATQVMVDPAAQARLQAELEEAVAEARLVAETRAAERDDKAVAVRAARLEFGTASRAYMDASMHLSLLEQALGSTRALFAAPATAVIARVPIRSGTTRPEVVLKNWRDRGAA